MPQMTKVYAFMSLPHTNLPLFKSKFNKLLMNEFSHSHHRHFTVLWVVLPWNWQKHQQNNKKIINRIILYVPPFNKADFMAYIQSFMEVVVIRRRGSEDNDERGFGVCTDCDIFKHRVPEDKLTFFRLERKF